MFDARHFGSALFDAKSEFRLDKLKQVHKNKYTRYQIISHFGEIFCSSKSKYRSWAKEKLKISKNDGISATSSTRWAGISREIQNFNPDGLYRLNFTG